MKTPAFSDELVGGNRRKYREGGKERKAFEWCVMKYVQDLNESWFSNFQAIRIINKKKDIKK